MSVKRTRISQNFLNLFLAVLILNMIVPTPSASAWGSDGHQIIAELAQANLNNNTKKILQRQLPGTSLKQLSTIPDNKKNSPGDTRFAWRFCPVNSNNTSHCQKTTVRWQESFSWHYQNQDTKEAIPGLKSEIINAWLILQQKDASQQERQNALAWLIHLVGDIHQPMHVGRQKDKGGNRLDFYWSDRESNLHQVWDSYLFPNRLSSADSYHQQLAKKSQRYILKKRLTVNQLSNVLDTWMKESAMLARGIYKHYNANKALLATDQGKAQNKKNNKAYTDYYQKIVNNQLSKAGGRLGGLINAAYQP